MNGNKSKENNKTGLKMQNEETKDLPLAYLIAVIVGILIITAFVNIRKSPQNEKGSILESADSSFYDMAESLAAQEHNNLTPGDSSLVTDESVQTDTAEIRGIVREANRYLVYPESYKMEMKSFPEDIEKEQKDALRKALGDYAYEEGFEIKSAEYVSEPDSNSADGVRIIGMILNGLDELYVTGVWDSVAGHGTSDSGQWLIIMDDGILSKARAKSPAVLPTVSLAPENGRRDIVSATPKPTMTPKATPTPTSEPRNDSTANYNSDYSPDLLEIRNVPDEIIEAIESAEEFRNSIYNFLYDNDMDEYDVAVDDYYEKYGDDIYDFTLNVSGEVIYGRYDRENNEYYYSFEAIG